MSSEDLLEALREGPASAQELADRFGEPTQSIARRLAWAKRRGEVIHSPLAVARAYARLDGSPPPRMGVWRLA